MTENVFRTRHKHIKECSNSPEWWWDHRIYFTYCKSSRAAEMITVQLETFWRYFGNDSDRDTDQKQSQPLCWLWFFHCLHVWWSTRMCRCPEGWLVGYWECKWPSQEKSALSESRLEPVGKHNKANNTVWYLNVLSVLFPFCWPRWRFSVFLIQKEALG